MKPIACQIGNTMKYSFNGEERQTCLLEEGSEIWESAGVKKYRVTNAAGEVLDLYWIGPEAFAEAIGADLVEVDTFNAAIKPKRSVVIHPDGHRLFIAIDGEQVGHAPLIPGQVVRLFPRGNPMLDRKGQEIRWTDADHLAAAVGGEVLEDYEEWHRRLTPSKKRRL